MFNREKVDMLELVAQTEDEKLILGFFKQAFELRRKKGKDYGDIWKDLGLRGQFTQVYYKTLRIKNLIWDKEIIPTNEPVTDSFIDLINFCFHCLILMGTDENKSKK